MRKIDFEEFIVHFFVGAVLGAVIGFGLYARLSFGPLYDIWDEVKAAWAFIGGGAVLGGFLLGFSKATLRHW